MQYSLLLTWKKVSVKRFLAGHFGPVFFIQPCIHTVPLTSRPFLCTSKCVKSHTK